MRASTLTGDMGTKPRLNVNVGILGHIDSGKTSLARAISPRLAASLDKAPQSASRTSRSTWAFILWLIR